MSNIPEGYKQTEVGVIPEDWLLNNVGNITFIQGGYAFNSKKFKLNGTYQVVKMSNLYQGLLNLTRSESFLDLLDDDESRFILKENDILITLTGTVGKRDYGYSYRINKENNLLLNQRVARIIVFEKHNPIYIEYQIKTRCFLNQFFDKAKGGTGNQANIGTDDIAKIKIPFPSTLTEQTAIATALSDSDSLISSLEKLISKKRAIKDGAMQELLTGKRRLPGFGGEWEVKMLGEIFTFLNTANNSRSELIEDGDIGYIHYGDIHTKWNSFLDCSTAVIPFIPKDKVEGLPFLEEGDLLLADASEDYGGLGASIEIKNIGNRKIVAGLHTLLLRGNKNILADGFKGYIRDLPGFKESLIKVATGISVYGISKNQLKSNKIKIPSVSEQTAIAKILSDMDREIEKLEQKLTKYRQIKQRMMEELLTGRIRLV